MWHTIAPGSFSPLGEYRGAAKFGHYEEGNGLILAADGQPGKRDLPERVASREVRDLRNLPLAAH